MIFIKRCGSLIRNFNSVHPTCTLGNGQRVNIYSTFVDEDRQIALFKMEIAVIRERGGYAPDVSLIKKHHWDELLALKSKSARLKYFKYLFKTEMTKKNNSLKRQSRKEERCDTYSLPKNTFFLRISRQAMSSWRNNRLLRAMQFGEKLIFDCSYDEHMTCQEAKNAATQLNRSFSDNRNDKEPFDLQFCNVNFNSVAMRQLEREMPTMRNKKFPMNLHESSYLDLFPKDQLVYLTPHCQNHLAEYDPNMIYIIGAMVDKTNHEPLSLRKAKALNLKMARLPLERYLNWGKGSSKWLTLDQMVRIMLDLKRTGKWELALRHVPSRKVASPEQNRIK